MPIFNLARAMPIVRTILPPIEFSLVPEHVLDTGAYFRARRIRRLLRFGQSMAAHRPPVDAAPQTFLSQPPLDRGRAISAVGPHVLGRIRWIENVVELLAVVHRRIGYVPFADSLRRHRSGRRT